MTMNYMCCLIVSATMVITITRLLFSITGTIIIILIAIGISVVSYSCIILIIIPYDIRILFIDYPYHYSLFP